jgi:hypothetical protein
MTRRTLTIAKFLSGLAAALILFNGVTFATWNLLYLAHGPAMLLSRLTSAQGCSSSAVTCW